jgi:hypothetical protein
MILKPLVLFFKALGPGERWITVRAPGHEKGQPLLIRDNPDGSAHVIGGAGGSMNMLKLRGVKSKEEYTRSAVEKQKARKEEKKKQREFDKKTGVHEAKQAARKDVAVQRGAKEADFVRTVADAMGWKKEELSFPEEKYEDLSDAAVNTLRNKHHRELLKRATEAVDMQRQALLNDADARAEAGLGEVPLESKSEDVISVADLDPVRNESAGLGFSADYKERAEQAGLTEPELEKEVKQAREQKQSQMTDAQRRAAISRGETAKLVKDELKGIRETDLPATEKKLVDAKKAVDLIKAQKSLREIQKKARDANKEIDKATEPKAFVLEVGNSDPDVTGELENDLRTLRTRAFLSEAAKHGELGKHVGVGAFNSINALALAAGGDALVDRSVVDVLGIAGASQVLARRLQTDLSADEIGRVADGMEEFHKHHYMAESERALKDAGEWTEIAKSIDVGEATTTHDLAIAQELNAKRREAVSTANRILGTALGEMEANAALTTALRQGKQDSLQVSMGNAAPESIIKQARAIGLQRGDYKLETAGANRFLTITGAGMDRLAKPINREDMTQVRRNLDIIEGKQDEDNWLPMGIANRPDLDMPVPAGVAPSLAEPFQPGDDLPQSLRDYIGGRMADGDTPAAIVADIQSADFFQKAGDHNAYRAALDAVAPNDGGQVRAEDLADTFDKYADAFVKNRYGGARSTLNKQKITVDQNSVDALHRALSEHPEGVAAFKAIGDLTPQDQKALRDVFYRDIAKEDPAAAEMRGDLEELSANEPERESTDMFGETATNPEWSAWRQQRDELAEKVNSSSLNWAKYADMMRGHENAYASIQDTIRSNVSQRFAHHYNTLNPSAPIKTGRTVIRNNLNHLDAVDPSAREARMAKERDLVDGLRERTQGRYASGSVGDKLDEAREQRAAFDQSQMGFFSSDTADMFGGGVAPAEKPLGADERHTIGHEAERTLAGMMGVVGRGFKPGQPLKLWNPTMSGGKNAARQRAIKLLEANKRVGLHFGVGTGKTLIGLGGFTHLHGKGLVKRGIFAVPSIVQGQFGGEALRYLEPGKFSWHCQPGAGREERIAAYKNPDHHFCVVTHQSLRDDMLHLGAQHAGVTPDVMRDRVAAMSPDERKDWGKATMEKEGINFDYLMVDEGHNLLDRAGKEDSGMSNVIGAVSANTPYHVSATGDPIKNSIDEAFSALQKMDPGRYTDRGSFMRKYGVNTAASKDLLRREMARYFYPSRIDPDVTATKREISVGLSDGQKSAMGELDGHVSKARLARMQGKVDVASMKAISPESFEGVPEAEHEKLAGELQRSLGIMKETARHRIINAHPESTKLGEISRLAGERKGKPGVVFAHSLAAVEQIRKRLEADGHRVVTITGGDSSKDKESKRAAFQDRGEADILVASDAASTGMNVQRASWLTQYDTPMTAKDHAQRQGRINRTGQKNNVELMDLVADHPSEKKARKRLADKYMLREMMTAPLEGLDDSGVASFLKQRQAAADTGQGAMF